MRHERRCTGMWKALLALAFLMQGICTVAAKDADPSSGLAAPESDQPTVAMADGSISSEQIEAMLAQLKTLHGDPRIRAECRIRDGRIASLSLRNCQRMETLGPFAEVRVDALHLWECDRLTNLEGLGAMGLTSLCVYGSTSLTSLAGIEKLPLQSVEVYSCSALAEDAFSILSGIASLERVHTGSRSRDQEILAACRRLPERGGTGPIPRTGPNLQCISVTPAGSASRGKSRAPAISGRGGSVAFPSSSRHLVPGDTNGYADVFVYRRKTRTIERVSIASDGSQGNGHSDWPAIGSDGRYVAFRSFASNLVRNDTNGKCDVFSYDRATKMMVCISRSSPTRTANGESNAPAISADGRYIAFSSDASDLVPDDRNGLRDVFLWDRSSGEIRRVSVGIRGEASGASRGPSISHDARFVAFRSSAPDLVAGDTNDEDDVFVYNRGTGQTIRVSISTDGEEANGYSCDQTISAGGRWVAYVSYASNLVRGDANGKADVFLRDLQQKKTERISVAVGGGDSDGHSRLPAICSSGRYVAFQSVAGNLVPGDGNRRYDVFLRDRETQVTTRVSVAPYGPRIPASSAEAALTLDGRMLAFSCEAAGVAGGADGELSRNVFLTQVGPALTATGRPGSTPTPGAAAAFAAYLIPGAVSRITTTYPELIATRHGQAMSEEQREAIAAPDGKSLATGTTGYHLFAVPNKGKMMVSWSGHADGNAQVRFGVWNGNLFAWSAEAQKSLRTVRKTATYTELVDRPLSESHVYVLVNGTDGNAFTDSFSFRTLTAAVAPPPAPSQKQALGPEAAYVFPATVSRLLTTAPDVMARKVGRVLTAAQLNEIAKSDEVYFGHPYSYYQLYCFRNRGAMRVVWRGYAEAGSIRFGVWGGGAFEWTTEAQRALRITRSPVTYSQQVNRPSSEATVYVLINPVGNGTVRTDSIQCELVDDRPTGLLGEALRLLDAGKYTEAYDKARQAGAAAVDAETRQEASDLIAMIRAAVSAVNKGKGYSRRGSSPTDDQTVHGPWYDAKPGMLLVYGREKYSTYRYVEVLHVSKDVVICREGSIYTSERYRPGMARPEIPAKLKASSSHRAYLRHLSSAQAAAETGTLTRSGKRTGSGIRTVSGKRLLCEAYDRGVGGKVLLCKQVPGWIVWIGQSSSYTGERVEEELLWWEEPGARSGTSQTGPATPGITPKSPTKSKPPLRGR